METSRKTFDNSIIALQSWRRKRDAQLPIGLFDHIRSKNDYSMSRFEYEKMRDFLITDILLSNSQRPGVIVGTILSEVEAAGSDVVEGYNRLIVSMHKTGYLQSAILFIYPHVYKELDFLTHNILSKLSNSPINLLEGNWKVFLGYDGKPLKRSQISPVIKKYLTSIGITFKGWQRIYGKQQLPSRLIYIQTCKM